jgi:hypothetical protein
MRVLLHLSAIALRTVAGPGSDSALHAFADRHGDRSAKLLNTLKVANAQAWKAIEVALAGSSWWDRAKRQVASGEQHAFRVQMQAFLDTAPLADCGPAVRKQCLAELKRARKAGLLPGEQLPNPAEVGESAKAMARFQDPRAVLDAEFECVRRTATELKSNGYEALSQVVELRPPGGQPLLVVAVQYFFRKEIQADATLSAEWQFQEMEKLTERQEAGFAGLHLALAEQGSRLEGMLDTALDLLEDTHAAARETRDNVAALRDEMATDRRQMAEMYAAVMKLLERQPAAATADPSETTIVEMRDLVEQCGTLPVAEKRQHKALFRAVGQMKKTVATFDGKRKLRKGVMPSALFGTPQLPPPPPAEDLPFAEEVDEKPAAGMVNTIFGQMPKPKIRKKS